MTMGQTISACLVIANEEPLIGRCLESLRGAVDEIVVVHDGPCRDRSLEICRRYTDRIFIRPAVGIAEPHRVFAMEQAAGDWVLWIDADEELTAGLRRRLPELVERRDADLYCFLWPYTDGRRDLTAGLLHPWRSCLARRSEVRFLSIPQEPLRSSGKVVRVPLVVRHRPPYDNYTWRRFLDKWQPRNRMTAGWVWRPLEEIPAFGRFTEAEKRALVERYRRRPLWSAARACLHTFAWHMGKGMWRLGPAGFRIAALTALNAAAIRWWIHRLRPPAARWRGSCPEGMS
jgi:glycosyltransferase involved in cell wall biosynthesis